MTENNEKRTKIFISYSWMPEENKEWVLDLADRLHREGVYVVIDEWDLGKGQDKYSFMEKMVKDQDINKVLLICNKNYVDKANERKGGVGEESLIMSKEIYEKVDQIKFIPIIRASKEDGSPYLPTFIHSRIGIDMRNSDEFEDKYEELMRDINNKPKRSRPPLGKLPNYITDDSIVIFSTAHKFRPLKDAIKNVKPHVDALMKEYFEELENTLLTFTLKDEEKNRYDYDDFMVSKFEQMKPLRDEVMEILHLYCIYNKEIETELLIKILEGLLNIDMKVFNTRSQYGGESYNDHISLFVNEVFLSLSALLLKNNHYKELMNILTTSYWKEDESKVYSNYIDCAHAFNRYLSSLNEHRKKRLNLNNHFVSSSLLSERDTFKYFSFEELVEIDSTIYYLGLLHNFDWYPRLSVFSRMRALYPFFQKLKSKRFFERAKVLFGVNSKNELIEKTAKIENDLNYSPHYNITKIQTIFNNDTIAIVN